MTFIYYNRKCSKKGNNREINRKIVVITRQPPPPPVIQLLSLRQIGRGHFVHLLILICL